MTNVLKNQCTSYLSSAKRTDAKGKPEALKMTQATPMPMCPMAKTCRSMMEKPFSGLIMIIPGITLMTLGVLIAVWPSILPWLVAAAFLLAGVAMLLMANFMRGVGAGLRAT